MADRDGTTRRQRVRRAGIGVGAAGGAILLAFLISSIALLLIDASPVAAFGAMFRYGARLESVVSILNRAVPLYVSALAVAVGFKMGLFNIGVEGQYRIAALIAASLGAAVVLPGPLHVLLIVVVGAVVGAAWAGIAGVLKVWRGVHEVISTIMLNTISLGLSAYLLANYLRERGPAGDLTIKTAEIPSSGRLPSLNPVVEAVVAPFGRDLPGGSDLQAFVFVAVLLGVAYYVLIWRTRFGYDLRAVGANAGAAEASGVDPRRMALVTMLLSGGLAGLVGMSTLLGFAHRYTIDFPVGLGFAGIAVALVGRNHPVGMAFGALLFAFLNRSAQILDFEGVPKEIEQIMQGVIILAVVIAYELARRLTASLDVRQAAAEAPDAVDPAAAPGAA